MGKVERVERPRSPAPAAAGPRPLLAALCAAAVVLAACKDPGTNRSLSRPLQAQNTYSGGTRGGGRPAAPSYEWMMDQEKRIADEKVSDAEKARTQGLDTAEALWRKAESERSPDDAADDYKKIADDHKDSPLAEEARWRESTKRVEDRDWNRDWNAAVSALDAYTRDYPITPHLRDAERLLYESSVNVFAGARGFQGIFKSDKKGYDGLNAIVERFPQGDYPDDALMALGAQYASKGEWPEAARAYLHIVLSYPDSPLLPQARLRLGDAYLARDHGPEYHAGYIDIDPRVPPPASAPQVRPVKSCVEAALESYEAYLKDSRGSARPLCGGSDIAYAEERAEDCRQRLAAKSRTVAAYYARCGQGEAAQTYERFAQNEEAGRSWCSGLASSLPGPQTPAVPATSPDARPTTGPASPSPVPPSTTGPTVYAPVGPTSSAPGAVAPSGGSRPTTFAPAPTPASTPGFTPRVVSTTPVGPPGPVVPSGSAPTSSPYSSPPPPAITPYPPPPGPTVTPYPPGSGAGASGGPAAATASPPSPTPSPPPPPPGALPPPRRTSRDGAVPR